MSVYLPTAVVGNDETLITLGRSAEIMGWFYPSKDHAQHIHECVPGIYMGIREQGRFSWFWSDEWNCHQRYIDGSNACLTTIRSEELGLEIVFRDVCPPDQPGLVRTISIRNLSHYACHVALVHYGDWNMSGVRTGNALRFDKETGTLQQSLRDSAVVIDGDALETWHCGKAGLNWHNNAKYGVESGSLNCNELEIGDVNWAFSFSMFLQPSEVMERTALFAMGSGVADALKVWRALQERTPEQHLELRIATDRASVATGMDTLKSAIAANINAGSSLSPQVLAAYERCLLCLPLLTGAEGVAVAAPEFDPEFVSCGGYGYFWPRDGAEYVSGLMDAGYPELASRCFDWCAKHQDPAGLWHQRYFLNGEPGPNWCLPPETLQIDQVGAVLWAYGKWLKVSSGGALPGSAPAEVPPAHKEMIRKAADYLMSRLTAKGVHGNAFDTWETFIGSFTYSNAALHAAFQVAADVLHDAKYEAAAVRVKQGVLSNFIYDGYLTRGLNQWTEHDRTIDSSSLGAIEPFQMLNLENSADLAIAERTLQAIIDALEVDFEGGRAIRRFQGDAYVGGVPACVNTLWMARCCCAVAKRLYALGRISQAEELKGRAVLYLNTVLRRSTPTGLLPELMQGPDFQRYWAAPHGWAMASYVTAVLMLANLP